MSAAIQSSAFTSVANATNWGVNTPSGVVAGDLMVALLWSGTPARAFNTPVGWSTGPTVAGAGFRMSVFTRSGTGSEPATYTFTNAVGAVGGHATMHRISGADLTSPIDASTYTELAASSASPWVASSIAPASAAATLLVDISYRSTSTGQTFTPPGSMAQAYNFNTGTSEKAAGFTEVLSASGATGTRSIAPSATATSGAIGMTTLAIAPATATTSILTQPMRAAHRGLVMRHTRRSR